MHDENSSQVVALFSAYAGNCGDRLKFDLNSPFSTDAAARFMMKIGVLKDKMQDYEKSMVRSVFPAATSLKSTIASGGLLETISMPAPGATFLQKRSMGVIPC